jgi:hypothetical protein
MKSLIKGVRETKKGWDTLSYILATERIHTEAQINIESIRKLNIDELGIVFQAKHCFLNATKDFLLHNIAPCILTRTNILIEPPVSR